MRRLKRSISQLGQAKGETAQRLKEVLEFESEANWQAAKQNLRRSSIVESSSTYAGASSDNCGFIVRCRFRCLVANFRTVKRERV